MENNNIVEEIGATTEKILTEVEVKELAKVLDSMTSDEAKMVQSLPSNNGVLENTAANNKEKDIIKEETVTIDPNTGTMQAINNSIDAEIAKLLEVNIEDLYEVPESAADIPYDPELIKANASNYGLKNTDIAALLPVIDKFRTGEDCNWYAELPPTIRKMINRQCLEVNNNSLSAKKLFAEELIRGLIRDAGIDRITIDLQQVTNKAFDISGIMKMTLDYQNTILETKMLETADNLEKDGKTDKAEHLRKVAAAYRQSYTLEDFINAAKSGRLRVKDFDVKKYARFANEFNYKYEKDTPFVINDITGIAPILRRKFPEFTTDQIVRFVIAFCKFCQNMDSKNVIDHTFMSYVIINISSLDLVVNDQEQDIFLTALGENIKAAVRAVNNI